MILLISILAVIATILVPLRDAARECPLRLAVAGSLYFSLIGMGFMLVEIALLQRFSVYLGHPIYSLSVCLFSLILASGLGSMTSDRLKLDSRGKLQTWVILVVGYLSAHHRSGPSGTHRNFGNRHHAARLSARLCLSHRHTFGRGCRPAADPMVLGNQRGNRRSGVGVRCDVQ
jgi:hypothetical protein